MLVRYTDGSFIMAKKSRRRRDNLPTLAEVTWQTHVLLRLSKGLSIRGLAKAAGVSREMLSGWLSRGPGPHPHGNPTLKWADKVTTALREAERKEIKR